MAFVLISLLMALAMMAAAFHAMSIEHRDEMYRRADIRADQRNSNRS